jgi:hypothetical protein
MSTDKVADVSEALLSFEMLVTGHIEEVQQLRKIEFSATPL